MLEKALKSVEAAPWNLAMVSFSPLVKIRVWPSIKYLKYTHQNEGTVHFAVIIFPHFEKLKRSRKALYSSFHIPQQWTFQVEEKQKVRRVRCGAWLAFNSPVLGHLALENVSIQRPYTMAQFPWLDSPIKYYESLSQVLIWTWTSFEATWRGFKLDFGFLYHWWHVFVLPKKKSEMESYVSSVIVFMCFANV